jgi:cyclophilin family peptidyl-prolyl cis-trans isomerase/HEAT repeat protein
VVWTALLFALLGTSCAAQQQLRQDLLDIEGEHNLSEQRLANTSVSSALLDIARYRDARSGSVAIAGWAAHPDPLVRSAAYRALGLVGGPIASSRLAGGLEDPERAVREAAAFGLSQVWAWPMAKLRARQLQEELSLLLDPLAAQDDAPFIALARSELPLAETPDWGETLAESSGSSYLFGAFGLLCKARKLAGEKAPQLPVLRPEALKAGAAVASPAAPGAAYALAQCGPHPDQSTDSGLVSWLADETMGSAADRAVSAWRALGRFEADAVLPLLRRGMVEAETPRLRLAALRALGQLGPPGEPSLLQALASEDRSLASEAAGTLARSGNTSAPGLLIELLRSEGAGSGPVARARLLALVRLSARPASSAEGSEPSSVAPPQDLITAALASQELVIRRVGFSLAVAVAVLAEDEPALRALLDASATSVDAGLPVVFVLALASRSEDWIEGMLLERLDSPNPLIAGIAVSALAEREGAHITQRLIAAYEKASAPAHWELREGLAVALLGRPGLSGALVIQMRDDPSAAVRLAVYRHAIEQEERVDLGPVPQELRLPDLPDAHFGVGDVQGATVVTSRGKLDLVLFPELAPAAVANFVRLVEQGFYTDLIFHRVVPDFVVQTGDPTGTGWGGPGHSIRDEFSTRPFLRGSLGMARSGKDTAGSQWFITHSRQPHLDRHYTLFGQLSGGWDVLDGIAVGDRIESITIQRTSR